MVISCLLVCLLTYYRHGALGYGFGKPLLSTFVLCAMLLAIAGFVGGALASCWYEAFRRDCGARQDRLTPAIFLTECLFAAASPVLGLALLSLPSLQRD
jgi:hypothetical protein